MDQSIAIITDSCADIPETIRDEKGIMLLPVLVNCAGQEYHDDVDITSDEVFAQMSAGFVPKTSLPAESDLTDLLDAAHDKGFTHAVVVTMSSSISGTYQMIHRVCNEYTGMVCKAFDSGMAAIAEGALAIQLADDIRAGLRWQEIEKRLSYLKKNTLPFFGLDTLKYLMRSGRIGKVTAMAGEMLNIKPILSFDANGVIDSVEKVRGRKAVINHLAERITKLAMGHKGYRLYFAHSVAPEDCKLLMDKVLAGCKEYTEIIQSNLGCALGVHLGPGLIGVAIQLLD